MKKRWFGAKELILVLCVATLTIFGCIMVYSASMYNAEKNYGNEYYFLIKQIIGVVLGAVGLVVFSFVDYEKLKKFKWWAVLASAVLLCLVFIPGIGVENYGARRWIGFGGFTIQPSEIAKFVLVFFCAVHLSQNHDKVKKFKTLIPPLLVGALFCGLVILEPNMSITMCLGLVLICMLFLGGMSLKHFSLLAIPAGLAVPSLIFMEPYRVKRLMAFLNPWASPQAEGFQLIQSLYGLANGNLFGVGLFTSRQKYRFLPFAESDFILSVIAEETGFFGVLALFLLIGFIVWRGFRIAARCGNFYGFLLAGGITLAFAVQSALNALVVSGCIPPTGLPLPLVSAGNTSLIVTMAGMGIVYGVSRHTQSKKLIQ